MTPLSLQWIRFCARGLSTVALLCMLLFVPAHAQEPQPSEYQIKAAFLYHFAQFVEWPAASFGSSTSPLIIAVLGDDPFGDALDKTILGKKLNEHPIEIRRIPTAAEATTNCHILFISSSEKERLSNIFSVLRNSPVLTVGETERFTESGGMINFVLQSKKIKFQINDDAAKAAGLKIRSKLLSLAVPGSR